MTTEVDGSSQAPVDDRSDAELITAVRGGDSEAYAVLYDRHAAAATRLARTLTRDGSEADDLVAEAFTRILATLQDGRGPDLAFRAYLHTTIRHTHYDRTKAIARTQPVEEVPEPEPGPGADDPTIDNLNRSLATRAFATLPERWQLVLWHTEVEGDTPATVAPLLGLTPNGVAALAYRARERLRQAYLQAHLTDTPPATTCAAITPLLAADIRGNLSARDHTKVTQHLDTCETCPALYAELTDLNTNLAALLAPAILGTTWATYLGISTATKTGILAALGAAGTATTTGIRETIQKIGPRNTAIGAGTAAAIAAAALAATLVAGNQQEPPPGA
ncbi:MAG: sigma-70 family RNA polymerase sigma factor, partial [Micromonosporaceae bacterium]